MHGVATVLFFFFLHGMHMLIPHRRELLLCFYAFEILRINSILSEKCRCSYSAFHKENGIYDGKKYKILHRYKTSLCFRLSILITLRITTALSILDYPLCLYRNPVKIINRCYECSTSFSYFALYAS